MVSVSLRQKPFSATDQNTSALASTAASSPASVADAAAASVAVRPVSGTPAWARNDHAPGTPRPVAPWEEWTIPPKPAVLTDTCEFTVPEALRNAPAARGVAAVRRPSPHPIEPSQLSPASVPQPVPASPDPAPEPGFRPWRVDFARPDVVEYPEVEQPEHSTVTKRLVLLLGLAYLFLAALASGLAYTGYFTTTANSDNNNGNGHGEGYGPEDDPDPGRDDRPDDPLPRPRPPSRHPDAPGLHTRPDGTRYLVMPLPADIADRFRGHTTATFAAPAAPAIGAAGAPAMIGGGAL